MRRWSGRIWRAVLVLLGVWCPVASAQEEPALPSGLEAASEEPALPEGLFGEPKAPKKARPGAARLPFDLTGFWEFRGGLRTRRDPHERDAALGETRLQLELEERGAQSAFKLTADLLYDPVSDHHRVDLERGRGWIDLRETSLLLTPMRFLDLKLGRQILTWGTGDLIFINDLFPKDWNSFFLGRDQEYLKAPSDAAKLSLYSDWANADIVYTPRFDADRYLDGERVSYWNGTLGRRSGHDVRMRADLPKSWLQDDEVAWRLFKNLGGYELAVYGYRGFWKSPAGVDFLSGQVTFPDLSVYGASIRGDVGRGIGHLEVGYYDSEDDGSGRNPLVRNGECRFLVGYEQEVGEDFTAALQYYLEHMMEYGRYRRGLALGARALRKDHHVATFRLTKLLMHQNLRLSLFTYYSPTDQDAYVRPNAHYKVDDRWSVEIGGNVFLGKHDHTFYGQFSKNSNLYVSVRYSF